MMQNSCLALISTLQPLLLIYILFSGCSKTNPQAGKQQDWWNNNCTPRGTCEAPDPLVLVRNPLNPAARSVCCCCLLLFGTPWRGVCSSEDRRSNGLTHTRGSQRSPLYLELTHTVRLPSPMKASWLQRTVRWIVRLLSLRRRCQS